MLLPDINRIIVKYVGPDIFDTKTIDLGWPKDIYFQMELTCLSDIVIYRKITKYDLDIDDIYNIDPPDEKRTMKPNTDVIYSLFYEDAKSEDYFTQLDFDMCLFLSESTPLSTYEYLARYPKMPFIHLNKPYLSDFIDISGLCMNKCVDAEYLLDTYPDLINWSCLTSNTNVPLDILHKHSDKIDQHAYRSRSDVPLDDFLDNESNIITGLVAHNPNLPVDTVVKKYQHRIHDKAWKVLFEKDDAPLEYILNNLRDKVLTTKIEDDDSAKTYTVLMDEIATHPKLPFDIIFDRYLEYIHESEIWNNESLPFDLVLEKYADKINWEDLGNNNKLPVHLVNDVKYRQLLKSGIIDNECLDFEKIDDINEFHDAMIEEGNRGYYTYLIEQRLLNILDKL